MSASPLNLNFSAIQGQANPPPQVIALTNTGGSTLYWHGTYVMLTSSWFATSPSGGQIAPGQTTQINTRINVGNLSPGTYTAQVTLFGADENNTSAGGSPLTIIVTLVVSAPCTLPQPSASALSFNAVQGSSNPTPQSVNITAYGSCSWPLHWGTSITSTAPWLNLSSAAGSFNTSGQSATLFLAPNIADLAPGIYQTQVSITAIGGTAQQTQGNRLVISVTLTVT